MTLNFLPKPERVFISFKWMLIRGCSCDIDCAGHIVPFSILKKINISEVPIDIEQWMIVIKQELLAYENLVNPSNVVKEGMATEGLVQEIDQAQPEEVSKGNKPSPKEKKEYISKGRSRKKPRIFGE